MPIPKKIYQTWCTRELPTEIEQNIIRFLNMNPGYSYELFTDEDMDNFVRDNYEGEIYNCYKRLNLIVSKADFWRYLILYKNGGIYVDMDGDILKPLDDLIAPDDSAIITAENNPNMFVQWALFFEPNHPILKRTIDLIVYNIKNNYHPHDVHQLTGPSVFSLAVYMTHDENFDTPLIHSNITSKTDTTYSKFTKNKFKFRIYGIDYNGFCSFNNPYKNSLYNNKIHWTHEQYTKNTVK